MKSPVKSPAQSLELLVSGEMNRGEIGLETTLLNRSTDGTQRFTKLLIYLVTSLVDLDVIEEEREIMGDVLILFAMTFLTKSRVINH